MALKPFYCLELAGKSHDSLISKIKLKCMQLQTTKGFKMSCRYTAKITLKAYSFKFQSGFFRLWSRGQSWVSTVYRIKKMFTNYNIWKQFWGDSDLSYKNFRIISCSFFSLPHIKAFTFFGKDSRILFLNIEKTKHSITPTWPKRLHNSIQFAKQIPLETLVQACSRIDTLKLVLQQHFETSIEYLITEIDLLNRFFSIEKR